MLTHVFLFPILAGILMIFTSLVCYGIAVVNDHVTVVWPYVSDTGALVPESCIFAQLLNITALLMAISIYLRHRQIVEHCKQYLQKRKRRFLMLSTIAMYVGLVACLGTSVVANFQETSIFVVHVIGAGTAFYAGLTYCWIQTVLSYYMSAYPLPGCSCMPHVRLVLCFVGSGFLASVLANQTDFYAKYSLSTNSSFQRPLRIDPSDVAYSSFVATTTSEWLTTVCFLVFMMTFAAELRHAHLLPPKLVLNVEPLPRLKTVDDDAASSLPKSAGPTPPA